MKNILLLALGLALAVVLGGCGLDSPTATQVAVEEEDIFTFSAGEQTVAGKLRVSEEPAGGFCELCQERDILLKAPSSPVDLVVNRGELDINALSAEVVTGFKGDYYLSKLVMKSNLPSGVAGRVFQNAKVVVYNIQEGSTLGILSELSKFRLGHSVLIPAGTTAGVRIYVDVAINPDIEDLRAVNESPEGPFTLMYVEVVNSRTRERIRSRGIVQQRLYISPTPEGCTGQKFSPISGIRCD